MMARDQFGPRDPMGGGNNRMPMKPMRKPHQEGFGHLLSNDKNSGFGNSGMQQQQQNAIELKLIFNRDEMAYLFGFDNVLADQLAQQTGAGIHMTDGECLEYVVAISGNIEVIFKAFSLICRKLWDFWTTVVKAGQQPLMVRIAVSGYQCGSIIGKQGAKIKEIRDMTGANIQVSVDNLPDSTERCVEITGNGETCLQCAYHICTVLQDAPLRPDNVPYIPKAKEIMGPGGRGFDPNSTDVFKPVFLCGDKAYIIDGNKARPAPPELLRRELSKTPLGGYVAETLTHGLSVNKQMPDHMNPLTLMAAISNSHRNSGNRSRTSREMWVNGEMMSIVRRSGGGGKMDEIQRMSGAQIHVAGEDELTPAGDVLVTVTGTEEKVLLAQFLVQSNIDLAMKERRETGGVKRGAAYDTGFPYQDEGDPFDNRPWGNRGGGPPPNKSLRGNNQTGFPNNSTGFNRGGFNNDRGGFQGDRGGFQNNRGGPNERGAFQNNRGGPNERGAFQNNRGGPNERGAFQNNRGGPNERGAFQNNRGGPNERGGFQSNRGGFKQQGFASEQGMPGEMGFQNDRSGFQNDPSGFPDDRPMGRGGGRGMRGGRR